MEKFLNKRIRIKNGWDDGTAAVGICTFIGPNEVLNIPLQVNIGRTPLRVKSIKQISFEPEPKKVFDI
jgi:hypothetical protein